MNGRTQPGARYRTPVLIGSLLLLVAGFLPWWQTGGDRVGGVLGVADRPDPSPAAPAHPAQEGSGAGGAPAIVIPVGTPMEEVERLVIRRTLEQTHGDKNLAAQILGIAARTIYRKLDRDEEGRLVERAAGPEQDE